MRLFKEKEKPKKKRGHLWGELWEEIVENILDGVLGLLWRLVAGFFHLIARFIMAVFHHIF